MKTRIYYKTLVKKRNLHEYRTDVFFQQKKESASG